MPLQEQQNSGILLIDKPQDISSFDVLRSLKKTFSQPKMGYLGTLDPLATGLLVVFLGKATKLIKYCEKLPKSYLVEAELGKTSDSYDITGDVKTMELIKHPNEEHFLKILQSFLGPQWQIQPPFSALKFQGKRAYEHAREGKEINLGKRQVEIHDIIAQQLDLPNFELELSCSTGTYIRSFIHELGMKLETGAIMKNLRRTSQGPFRIEDAVSLSDISTDDAVSIQEFFERYADDIPAITREKAYIQKSFQ